MSARDCRAEYFRVQVAIGEALKTIAAQKKAHGEKFEASECENWGYVGDMTHVLGLLKEIVAFMPPVSK